MINFQENCKSLTWNISAKWIVKQRNACWNFRLESLWVLNGCVWLWFSFVFFFLLLLLCLRNIFFLTLFLNLPVVQFTVYTHPYDYSYGCCCDFFFLCFNFLVTNRIIRLVGCSSNFVFCVCLSFCDEHEPIEHILNFAVFNPSRALSLPMNLFSLFHYFFFFFIIISCTLLFSSSSSALLLRRYTLIFGFVFLWLWTYLHSFIHSFLCFGDFFFPRT